MGEGPKKDDVTVSHPGALEVHVTGAVGKGRWNVRATGLTAVGVSAAASVFGILLFGDPLHNAAAFMAAIFASFVAGATFSVIIMHGRLTDALKEKDNYRLEVERVTVAKRECEKMLLRQRLSSAPPGAKKARKKT